VTSQAETTSLWEEVKSLQKTEAAGGKVRRKPGNCEGRRPKAKNMQITSTLIAFDISDEK